MALKQSKKMKLSKFELVLIYSFIEKDDENMVLFKQAARIVGELIKRFFSSVMNGIKVHSYLFYNKFINAHNYQGRFEERRLVSTDEKISGWTQDEIQKDMDAIFDKFDLDKNN